MAKNTLLDKASSGTQGSVSSVDAQPAWVVTDSAWFWLLVFSGMALVAMVIVDRKYGPRQAQIERQFQGRQYQQKHPWRPADGQGADGHSAEGEAPAPADLPKFSQPDDTLITLWPLRALALILMVAATIGLVRERRRAAQPEFALSERRTGNPQTKGETAS